MTIKFIGHACFLLTDSQGFRVIIDPYEPGAFGHALNYGPVTDEADVILVSHEHADHNYVRGVPGNPQVCRQACTIQGREFKATVADHDEAGGSKRGQVTLFHFTLDGIAVCHLGDLGAPLTPAQVADIGPVDLLLLPVGGTFTVDADLAWQVAQQIAPCVLIPMHYKTAKTRLPLAALDEFVNNKPNVERPGTSQITLTRDDLTDALRIIVLLPAA